MQLEVDEISSYHSVKETNNFSHSDHGTPVFITTLHRDVNPTLNGPSYSLQFLSY
jgi:hypothetical protein